MSDLARRVVLLEEALREVLSHLSFKEDEHGVSFGPNKWDVLKETLVPVSEPEESEEVSPFDKLPEKVRNVLTEMKSNSIRDRLGGHEVDRYLYLRNALQKLCVTHNLNSTVLVARYVLEKKD